MDAINIKNQTLIELMHKVESLAKNELYGKKTPYCWDDVVWKYKGITILEDATADQTVKDCILYRLNDTIDPLIINRYISTITQVYIPIDEPHYRGTIATAQQMAAITSSAKQEGWWWKITGSFTYDGVVYSPENEVYWTNTGWSLFGYNGVTANTSSFMIDVQTGALSANVPKSVSHSLGKLHCTYIVKDNDNNVLVDILKADPSDPTNKVIIQVGVDVPEGLTISVIGY